MKQLSLVTTILLAAVASVIFFSACSGGAQPITGRARDSVLAYADSKTDNLLDGYNSGVYAVFARDFDAAMRNAETEPVFNQTRTQLMSKLGPYVSRQVTDVVMQGNFVVVLYSAKFEQADGVTVRVVFTPEGEHPITGLWFNSPKLQ